MFRKNRLFTLIALITILTFLPTTALADSFTVGGVSVTAPSSYDSCSPADNIVFSGVGSNTVEYWFFRYDVATNYMIPLVHDYLTADASVPFPYPSITGALTFSITVIVTTPAGARFKGQTQWTITCTTPPGGEGCTPGYWKNHLGDWPPTGYATTDIFDTVFGTNYFDPDINLLQAVNLGGGGVKRAARHGTAALLNAASPDVDYPYTVAEVIAMVQSLTIDPLAQANELGCRIP